MTRYQTTVDIFWFARLVSSEPAKENEMILIMESFKFSHGMLAVLYNFPHKTAKGKTTDDWSWTDNDGRKSLWEHVCSLFFINQKCLEILFSKDQSLSLHQNMQINYWKGRQMLFYKNFDPIARRKPPEKPILKENLPRAKYLAFSNMPPSFFFIWI